MGCIIIKCYVRRSRLITILRTIQELYVVNYVFCNRVNNITIDTFDHGRIFLKFIWFLKAFSWIYVRHLEEKNLEFKLYLYAIRIREFVTTDACCFNINIFLIKINQKFKHLNNHSNINTYIEHCDITFSRSIEHAVILYTIVFNTL